MIFLRIDAVLLSHNHYDHLDVPTLRRIRAKYPSARILAGLGVRAFLEGRGLGGSEEFDWWNGTKLGGVRVTCVPARHFSSRGAFDRDETLWCAWVLEGKGGNVYFAGDTGYGPHFRETGKGSARSASRCFRSARTSRAGSWVRSTRIPKRRSTR